MEDKQAVARTSQVTMAVVIVASVAVLFAICLFLYLLRKYARRRRILQRVRTLGTFWNLPEQRCVNLRVVYRTQIALAAWVR
jgi:hypothetical protein